MCVRIENNDTFSMAITMHTYIHMYTYVHIYILHNLILYGGFFLPVLFGDFQ